jgi:hypothetical protein
MVTLTDIEARALRRALENYLPELRYELARVKLESTRHDLVELERLLTDIEERLGSESVSPTPQL